MRNIHYRLWSSDGEPIERRWMLPLVFTTDYFGHTDSLLKVLHELSEDDRENLTRSTLIAHEIVLNHWLHADVRPSRPEIVDHRLETIHDMLIDPECKRYDTLELSHASGLSISQMNRLFKRVFDCSPKAVLGAAAPFLNLYGAQE